MPVPSREPDHAQERREEGVEGPGHCLDEAGVGARFEDRVDHVGENAAFGWWRSSHRLREVWWRSKRGRTDEVEGCLHFLRFTSLLLLVAMVGRPLERCRYPLATSLRLHTSTPSPFPPRSDPHQLPSTSLHSRAEWRRVILSRWKELGQKQQSHLRYSVRFPPLLPHHSDSAVLPRHSSLTSELVSRRRES
jgi:hypothetical protein